MRFMVSILSAVSTKSFHFDAGTTISKSIAADHVIKSFVEGHLSRARESVVFTQAKYHFIGGLQQCFSERPLSTLRLHLMIRLRTKADVLVLRAPSGQSSRSCPRLKTGSETTTEPFAPVEQLRLAERWRAQTSNVLHVVDLV